MCVNRRTADLYAGYFASLLVKIPAYKINDRYHIGRSRKKSVRIKGLEPPRREASDPKSDVATNYTISADRVAKVGKFRYLPKNEHDFFSPRRVGERWSSVSLSENDPASFAMTQGRRSVIRHSVSGRFRLRYEPDKGSPLRRFRASSSSSRSISSPLSASSDS